ncbi:DUF4870 domain-containing protein [Halocalculus aciditolerans]|uniref:Membrane protein n=1 Tax=Halocalculus aciditolerans TaxID=1383812 RepID=A0A830FCK9_9EURY|nr:hypothetical protein [Halocalculus aciditolerans]GGL61524.1 membrane protein [Halocalculus aciditolerans]
MTTTEQREPAMELGREPRATAGAAGLDENVAGALAYLFGVVTGVAFFLVDDRAFVRFHAAQSIAVSGVVVVAYVALSILQLVVSASFFAGGGWAFALGSALSLLLGVVWLVMGLGAFGLWLYLLVRAYQGQTPRVPVAAGLADRLLDDSTAE